MHITVSAKRRVTSDKYINYFETHVQIIHCVLIIAFVHSFAMHYILQ